MCEFFLLKDLEQKYEKKSTCTLAGGREEQVNIVK